MSPVLVMAAPGAGSGGPNIPLWIFIPVFVIIIAIVVFQMITRLRPGSRRSDG